MAQAPLQPAGQTYGVERSATLASNSWTGVTNFVAGSGVFTWLESVSNGWTKAFYRLRGPE